MAQCKLCGTTFNEDEAETIDCNCGCGSDLYLCPNCGYAIKLSVKEKEEKRSFLKKLTDAFRMGY
ncbi:hypothetical protein [Methanosphaera cuniculi]|uniref:hypothetical protein n=1 Tax=Methanosphaera cuniculi TaxID=1077256 RepID=UPI0026EB80BA|nr:hypothetical protein [Methanosphaera cuniculi]